jgi:hypothetical protein
MFACIRAQQRRQHAYRGCLTCAVRAEQSINRAARNLEVDAIDRARGAEGLGEAGNFDRMGRAHAKL